MDQTSDKEKSEFNAWKAGLYLLGLLFIFTISIWQVTKLNQINALTVSVLNIGQGDAIYIKAPNGTEMIVDGGPDQKLLSELGSVMPFFDTTIDLIMVTNPDKDHYAGFIDLLTRYTVGKLIEPGTISSTPTYHSFKEKIVEKNIETVIARRGMKLLLDEKENVYIEIVFPDHDVTDVSSNEGSIVAKLVYGNTCMMLQGDATANVERQILAHKDDIHCQLLKTGHHGSRTSSSENYVRAVSPQFALISDGIDNRYGHPHKEVLDIFQKLGVQVLRTDLEGRITFVSNGKEWVRN